MLRPYKWKRMDCAAEGDFWGAALSGGAASFAGGPARVARSSAARGRAGCAARGDEQSAFSVAPKASAARLAERDAYLRSAHGLLGRLNDGRRKVVVARR